jgi:hypothetical protein
VSILCNVTVVVTRSWNYQIHNSKLEKITLMTLTQVKYLEITHQHLCACEHGTGNVSWNICRCLKTFIFTL